MKKLANYRVYVILGAIVACVLATILIRNLLISKEIKAFVGPLDVEIGTPINYADSTRGANHWLWEFGDGSSSPMQKGQYLFEEIGKYQIRLTTNGGQEKKFLVNVRPKKQSDDDQLVKVFAPSTGLQGEYIVFRGEGLSKEWRWEFGETGVVDAREKSAIYKYDYPGAYEVLLSTEETKYPIRHRIEILPQYMESDSTNMETLIGNDIKEKLQNIIDQKPFNRNYNYVLESYLCQNSNAIVVINNTKKNDFYSYCQGLKIIGRGRTTIENVIIDLDPYNDDCVLKLNIIQSDY